MSILQISARRISLMFLALFLTISLSRAGEGMWLPFLLKALNESEMKAMGMKMRADDIYSVNHGSLKDAVVHFGGFCTGELVSDQGLLLTNHHCGYDAIQAHSTLENNYIRDGFWAKDLSEEMPNPGLFATFIVRIDDVSSKAFEGVLEQMQPAEKKSIIERNLNTIKSSAMKESWQEVFIKPFFEGNQYFLFVTETYKDVRYVGSPPESIGKFGGDTDNWVWPRHNADFSVFRIYAGPDNKPAEYSPDNKPYKPKHFFPISLAGVKEGDFTLVFGFPGRTNEYLPSSAIAQTADIIDPARIGVRDISLGIMDRHMRSDEDARLAYFTKYSGIANSWKKWIGEVQGLKSKKVVQEKEKQEAALTTQLGKDKALSEAYSGVLPQMKTLYAELDTIVANRVLLGEVIGGSNVEIFLLTAYADRLVKSYKDGGEDGFRKMEARITPVLETFFRKYRVAIDQELFVALTQHLSNHLSPQYKPDILTTGRNGSSFEDWAIDVFQHTMLTQQESFTMAVAQGGESFTKAMESDRAYQVFLQLKKVMDEQLSPAFNSINDKLLPLQKDYVAAQMAAYPDRRFWPDANSTLRVAYGQVEPYAPRDGMTYKTQTYLDGIMEKYKPGDYEFDVDPRLIALYEKKDYGPYGENGKMPVCFIASNHTTGGNSGSPAIDAHGNLIGINFDRVWEGTMSDLYYDESICRNIMVDIRYVLFVMDKLAGASNLVNEMTLVHAKKRK